MWGKVTIASWCATEIQQSWRVKTIDTQLLTKNRCFWELVPLIGVCSTKAGLNLGHDLWSISVLFGAPIWPKLSAQSGDMCWPLELRDAESKSFRCPSAWGNHTMEFNLISQIYIKTTFNFCISTSIFVFNSGEASLLHLWQIMKSHWQLHLQSGGGGLIFNTCLVQVTLELSTHTLHFCTQTIVNR